MSSRIQYVNGNVAANHKVRREEPGCAPRATEQSRIEVSARSWARRRQSSAVPDKVASTMICFGRAERTQHRRLSNASAPRIELMAFRHACPARLKRTYPLAAPNLLAQLFADCTGPPCCIALCRVGGYVEPASMKVAREAGTPLRLVSGGHID